MNHKPLHARPRRRGFTLMEVLLVLAILIILGALVGVAYNRVRENSLKDSANVQISLFETSLEVYQNDLKRLPENLEELRDRPTGPGAERWRGPYLEQEIPLDPWDRPYQYELGQDEYDNTTYFIHSMGPDGQSGTDDDISNRPTRKP